MADTYSITGFAKSKHDKEMNGDHNWIGLKYEHDNGYGAEIASFKNSWGKNTKAVSANKTFYAIDRKGWKVGGTISLVLQDGYCISNYEAKQCGPNDDDTSIIVVPSIIVKYNRVGINITGATGIVMANLQLDF